MNIINKDLKRRIIEISYLEKLSHLGSCLTAIDIIEEVYQTKREDEHFILSQGHTGLALYVAIEKHYGANAHELYKKHGVHPNRDLENHISCSAGSLGQGLPVALGMAVADRSKNVYCMISDGECAEGSIWEALRIKYLHNVDNLKVYANLNGYSAYDKVNLDFLVPNLVNFDPDINLRATTTEKFEYELPFLKGIDAHYYAMNQEDYEKAMQIYE